MLLLELYNKQYNSIDGYETCEVQTNPLVIGKNKKFGVKIRVYLSGKDTPPLKVTTAGKPN